MKYLAIIMFVNISNMWCSSKAAPTTSDSSTSTASDGFRSSQSVTSINEQRNLSSDHPVVSTPITPVTSSTRGTSIEAAPFTATASSVAARALTSSAVHVFHKTPVVTLEASSNYEDTLTSTAIVSPTSFTGDLGTMTKPSTSDSSTTNDSFPHIRVLDTTEIVGDAGPGFQGTVSASNSSRFNSSVTQVDLICYQCQGGLCPNRNYKYLVRHLVTGGQACFKEWNDNYENSTRKLFTFREMSDFKRLHPNKSHSGCDIIERHGAVNRYCFCYEGYCNEATHYTVMADVTQVHLPVLMLLFVLIITR